MPRARINSPITASARKLHRRQLYRMSQRHSDRHRAESIETETHATRGPAPPPPGAARRQTARHDVERSRHHLQGPLRGYRARELQLSGANPARTNPAGQRRAPTAVGQLVQQDPPHRCLLRRLPRGRQTVWHTPSMCLPQEIRRAALSKLSWRVGTTNAQHRMVSPSPGRRVRLPNMPPTSRK